jgi:uncharacterized protein YneF (UPF0154 family)
VADNVVAEVKIRVRPDTSRFGKDLKRQVKAKVDEVNAKNKFNVKVGLELDDNALKSKLKTTVEKAEKAAGSIEIKVDLDDTKSLDRGIARIKAELLALDESKTIKIDLDTAELESELAALEHRKRTIEFNTKLKGAGVSTLAKLTGARLVQANFKHFLDFFSNLDKKIPAITLLTLAIHGLSGAMIAATADAFSLARSLAQIGPGAVALPGLFGGIAVGLLGSALALRDFNKELPGVKSQLAGIRAEMSDAFWQRARQPMVEMFSVLLPKIQSGFTKTGTALGTFFGNLATSFKDAFDGNVLTRMFARLNSSIRIFAGYTEPIARLFRIFGDAGTKQLPDLARWTGDLVRKFANFMQNAERAGRITVWIETAKERISDLGRVLLNTGRLFRGLARAADNATPTDALDSLANGLDRIQKYVNSGGVQRRLTGLFKAAHVMMSNIAKQSGPAFSRFITTWTTHMTQTLPQVGRIIGKLLKAFFEFASDPAIQRGMTKLLDGIESGVNKLVPLTGILAEKSGAMMGKIGAMADLFGGVFAASVRTITPLLTVLLNVIAGLLEVLAHIPTPVLQVVIAFFAARKAMTLFNAATKLTGLGVLMPALTSASVGLRTFAQSGQKATLVTNGLKNSLAYLRANARTGAAAIGILGASLSATAGEADHGRKVIGNLMTDMGFGFAAGGPIGAAIGMVTALARSQEDLNEKFEQWLGLSGTVYDDDYGKKIMERAAAATKNYANQVDNLKNAMGSFQDRMNGQARFEAFTQLEQLLPGLSKKMNDLGVSERTLGLAAMGNKNAINQVMTAYNQAALSGDSMGTTSQGLADILNNVALRSQDATNQLRTQALVTQDLTGLMGKIPKNVYSYINLRGVEPTVRGIAKVAKKFPQINNKQLKAFIDVLGVDASVADIRRYMRQLKDAGKVKAPKPDIAGPVKKGADDAGKAAKTGGSKVVANLKQAINRPLLGFQAPLAPAVGKGITKAHAKAGEARGVGTYMASGVVVGINSGAGSVAAAGRAMIANALAQMRAAAKIKSPSRETMLIGKYLGEGLVIGLGRQKKKLLATAKSLISDLLKHGLSAKEAPEFQKRLNSLTSLLPHAMKGMSKAQVKALQGRRESLLKAISPEKKQLNKLYGEWSSVAGKIKGIVQSIFQQAASLRQTLFDSIKGLGDPTQLVGEGGTVTFAQITDNLTAAIEKAKRFAVAMAQLKAAGLNNTTLAQLVNAGPDAGLAAAEAIANAGKAQVKALNEQQAQVEKFANQAGIAVEDLFITNGMRMADGLLKGLRDKRKEIEQEMRHLAQVMVKTIKKELGIKSPSRVFKKIGTHVSEGLDSGIRSVDVEPPQIRGAIGLDVVDRRITASRAESSDDSASIHIDNLSIPLEDLEQLQELEDFLALLRVRSRQGAPAA